MTNRDYDWTSVKISAVDCARIHQTGVYRIRHLESGHVYIGSTSVEDRGFQGRWSKHIRELHDKEHHCMHLENAWHKYGYQAFIFEIVELCPSGKCIEREQWYLDNVIKWGIDYNICRIAGSCLGVTRSQETKDKIGAVHKGKTVSESTRRLLAEAGLRGKGRKLSATAKINMSNAAKGKKKSPEAVAKMRAIKTGKKLTEAHKQAISDGLRGHECTPDTKAKIGAASKARSSEISEMFSEANKGKPKSESHREKLREANLGKKASPVTRRKMSDTRTGMAPSEETRQKQSEVKRAYWQGRIITSTGES